MEEGEGGLQLSELQQVGVDTLTSAHACRTVNTNQLMPYLHVSITPSVT